MPAAQAGKVAALPSRLPLDAPAGDLAVERERHDAGRVRAQDATRLGRGHAWPVFQLPVPASALTTNV
ncbi:hypothetical protein [Actinoplanes sp. NPDC051411]|uniref:hypothetical protein n=1 Tax=Actinoplanes sp. NPDC051411 TaxID=3155522 RepID=UPI00341EC263